MFNVFKKPKFALFYCPEETFKKYSGNKYTKVQQDHHKLNI